MFDEVNFDALSLSWVRPIRRARTKVLVGAKALAEAEILAGVKALAGVGAQLPLWVQWFPI